MCSNSIHGVAKLRVWLHTLYKLICHLIEPTRNVKESFAILPPPPPSIVYSGLITASIDEEVPSNLSYLQGSCRLRQHLIITDDPSQLLRPRPRPFQKFYGVQQANEFAHHAIVLLFPIPHPPKHVISTSGGRARDSAEIYPFVPMTHLASILGSLTIFCVFSPLP